MSSDTMMATSTIIRARMRRPNRESQDTHRLRRTLRPVPWGHSPHSTPVYAGIHCYYAVLYTLALSPGLGVHVRLACGKCSNGNDYFKGIDVLYYNTVMTKYLGYKLYNTPVLLQLHWLSGSLGSKTKVHSLWPELLPSVHWQYPAGQGRARRVLADVSWIWRVSSLPHKWVYGRELSFGSFFSPLDKIMLRFRSVV